ncbi:MAG TPA: metallophosphoesterase family protein, partial [Propioniciclava tarda]|nr:metallophosphoesterase family protein [Propioniciclava tarda]
MRIVSAAALTLAVGAACVAYGTFVESAAYRVRRYDVPVLEPGSEPLRVLHFSDVHLLPWQRRRLAFVASLAGLRPDLVISTGDNLSSPDAVGAFGDALEPLLGTPGGFVFGSNDFQGPRFRNPISYVWKTSAKEAGEAAVMRPDEVREALASGGWLDLNNARGTVDVRGQTIELRGTGDAHESRDKYAQVAGPPAAGTVPLGVTHAPYSRVLDAMARDGVRLVFAGHTHGGQVCVPGYGALTSNCDLPPAQAKGLFRHETADGHSCWVHVSGGVGMSPFAPFRFACPPEVSLLTLTPRPE